MKRVILFLGVFIFIFVFFVPSVFANVLFEDSFSAIDSDTWFVSLNNGSVVSSDGSLVLSSEPSFTFPYVYNKVNIFPDSNYAIELSISFDGNLNYGAGLALSDVLLPNGSTVDLNAADTIFQIWPESQNKYSIWTSLCQTGVTPCIPSYKKIASFAPNGYHKLVVFVSDSLYTLAIDDSLQTTSYYNSRSIKYIWIGNPQKTNTETTKPNIHIDYIKITGDDDEVANDPVIILPGFGGSWDVDAVLSGLPGDNWKIPEFVKEYDGLINSIKNAGYEENKDLFIFAYDWRKSLDSLADDLNNFLVSKNLSEKKIKIVGHSMGGLVARSYLQKYNNHHAKLITAGSPNMGIVDAYGMWEGNTIWDAVWWQKALHFIATEVNRLPGELKIDSARRNTPSIKDMLPTWNFLKLGKNLTPIEKMKWKNDYLISKNDQIENYQDQIKAGFSDNYNTKNILKVERPSREDLVMGLWEDGKPKEKNPFENTAGDGYVTSYSSSSLFNDKINLQGGHGEVISRVDNIIKILSDLGIATESAVGSDHDTRRDFLVFKLNSPGKMSVCISSMCDSQIGYLFSDQKMLIVPSFKTDTYDVHIDANNEFGEYELLIGKSTDDVVWNKEVGELKTPNQVDAYLYSPISERISLDTDTALRKISKYYPNGFDLSKTNQVRQTILKEIDRDIKNNDFKSFNDEVNKWTSISNFIEQTETNKMKWFSNKSWDERYFGLYKAKSIPVEKSYYTESLLSLIKQTEKDLDNTDKKSIFLKLDKKLQLIQLQHFVGHGQR